jgi:hypothetical protein
MRKQVVNRLLGSFGFSCVWKEDQKKKNKKKLMRKEILEKNPYKKKI